MPKGDDLFVGHTVEGREKRFGKGQSFEEIVPHRVVMAAIERLLGHLSPRSFFGW